MNEKKAFQSTKIVDCNRHKKGVVMENSEKFKKLEKFVRKFSFFPDTCWQGYVQEVDRFIYATNGSLVVRSKGYRKDELIFPEDVVLVVAANKLKGYFEEVSLGEPKIFETKKLKKMLAKRKTEPVLKKTITQCSMCEGSGSVIWEYEGYERDDSCPSCNGEGQQIEVSSEVERYKYPPDKNVYFFKHIGLAPKLLEKLLELGSTFKIYKTNSIFLKGSVDEFEFVVAMRK